MRKLVTRIVFWAMLGFVACGHAAERGTKDEAVAMVKKAIAFLKKNGIEKTVAEVHNPKGQFIDRDLYVVISDLKNINIANGATPKMAGKDIGDIRDADGVYFVRKRNEMLKTVDHGWLKYRWSNPAAQKIESKEMYFEKFGDYVVSCGIYGD